MRDLLEKFTKNGDAKFGKIRNFEKQKFPTIVFFGKCALVFNIAFVLIIVLGDRGELWEFYVVVFALTPFINAESFFADAFLFLR